MPIIKNVNELTERIKFKKTKRVKDEDGQMVDSEETVFECWANVRSQMLKDVLASVGTMLEGTLTFIIRYDQDYELTNDMKVAWKNKSYKIISINEGTVFKDYTTIIAKQIS
ncbi:MAG: phage head closure protein [Enterococcus faecium]|uniref:phage head closure protein n=1 Tax=Enterococcus faecium TaxID=1352 RepID=UPI00093ECE90|nr:phage head closure protein [Enterococcus faecium]MBK4788599.1 phage head-tail adaptor [Enterococcus faecium]MBK4849188.1 phage head-tail adaptor [Enterococcus faecium]MBK4870439.1 phage head-tail adaptor [Enterococcus faecium]MBK4876098.1 phage head-tail adaptor [Enterococcus faecium]PHL03932.1 head-tail adaptor protein [Enterococcus faecium]